MQSKLVIFDIDGTLTRTNEADEICFARSVREEFGIENLSTDWSDYEHSTDSGILLELIRREKSKELSKPEIHKFQDTMKLHLEKHRAEKPDSFQPVQGALKIFSQLKEKGLAIAIATGAWKKSAEYKLSQAGIPVDGLPIATADDHLSRDQIILLAESRAKEVYGQTQFERLIYVGDGPWDFVSSKRLGISFVGIHDHRTPERLTSLGASRVVKDYADFGLFFDALMSSPLLK